MGIFSVDTSDKLAGLCAAGLGIATCGAGVLPVGLAVAGAVLALPGIYKHFKGTDEETYQTLINPPKAVIKKQFAAWEKSSEFITPSNIWQKPIIGIDNSLGITKTT